MPDAHFAIGLIRVPDGCCPQRIASAEHRHIDIAPAQALNVGKRRVNPAKAFFELGHSLLKRFPRIGHFVPAPVWAGTKTNDAFGQGIGAALAIA